MKPDQQSSDKRTHSRRKRRCQLDNRAGVTLLESAIAATLLASVMVFLLPAAGWIVREWDTAFRRQAASEELANLMDCFTREPWEEITLQRAGQLQLAEQVQLQLPEAALAVKVERDGDAKRIQMTLSWKNRSGQTAAPIRLATWVYPPAERNRDASSEEGQP